MEKIGFFKISHKANTILDVCLCVCIIEYIITFGQNYIYLLSPDNVIYQFYNTPYILPIIHIFGVLSVVTILEALRDKFQSINNYMQWFPLTLIICQLLNLLLSSWSYSLMPESLTATNYSQQDLNKAMSVNQYIQIINFIQGLAIFAFSFPMIRKFTGRIAQLGWFYIGYTVLGILAEIIVFIIAYFLNNNALFDTYSTIRFIAAALLDITVFIMLRRTMIYHQN